MGGWMDGWMDGWVDGWMDGWMDRQTERQINCHFMEEKSRKIEFYFHCDTPCCHIIFFIP
jgi:hypothetical protein